MLVKKDGKVFGCGINVSGMCGSGSEDDNDIILKITEAPYNFGQIKDI